jgi:hypothetical protein
MTGPFGIIRGEAPELYHANDAVSSTRLMDMRIPRLYHMRHVVKTLPREDKREFDIGTAAHCLILEGRKALEERTVLQPATYPCPLYSKGGKMLTSKPWHNGADYCKSWTRAANEDGKTILTAEDFATIDKMAQAVEENPDAVALLTGGESEVTFRVQHPAFAVQARADHWHADEKSVAHSESRLWFDGQPICVDLKTCDTIEQFRAHYFQHRYYYRAAFYRDVIADALGMTELPAFVFVAVEKSAPWRCEVFEPMESDLELGRAEMLADLKTLRGCFESGIWSGSKLGVQPIELTSWQRRLSESAGASLYAEAS